MGKPNDAIEKSMENVSSITTKWNRNLFGLSLSFTASLRDWF